MNNRSLRGNAHDQVKSKTQLIPAAARQVIAKLEKLAAGRRRAVLAIRETYEYLGNIVDTAREPRGVPDPILRVVG